MGSLKYAAAIAAYVILAMLLLRIAYDICGGEVRL